MPPTVLIGPRDQLTLLTERGNLDQPSTFADTEALRALDAITRLKPAVIALERTFAATSRGAALINRVKADPSLSGCEIRIVSADPDASPDDATAADAVAVPATEVDGPVAPLDQRGTRRAPRFVMVEGVEVLADGKPATVIDLSVRGAQVVSGTVLKPNQRLRVQFPDATPAIRVAAAVAWAAFEMPKSGPRYRAGLEFFEADADALTRFIDTRKKR